MKNTKHFLPFLLLGILLCPICTGCATRLTPPQYTITFDSNDGTGAIKTITSIENVSINLPEYRFPQAANSGVFLGWGEERNGISHYSEKKYTSHKVKNYDTTLYALWETTSKDGNYTYVVINDKALIIQYIQDATNLVIPEKIDEHIVNTIKGKSFRYKNMITVTFPNTVTFIGTCAFYKCSKLRSINIPASIIRLENDAFYNCTSLVSVDIPASAEDIPGNPFRNCTALTTLSVNPENAYYTTVDNVLFNKDRTVLFAYAGGKPEGNYTIPNSVTMIRSYAFSGCTSLETLTISENVKDIRYKCFSSCNNLVSITLKASVPPKLNKSAFNEIADDCIIYVPAESINEYKTTTN